MVGLAPDARLRFATRLKRLRLQRGFARARFFARALGIEENRYTRYERAEVEPSLTLLQKICDTLHVTPNELLGFAEVPPALVAPGSGAPGAADRAEGARADPAGARAWLLASSIVRLRQEHLARQPEADALEALRETASLFAELQAKPFATVAAVARDPYLTSAPVDRRAALATLIKAFTDGLSAAAE
jgi:transcriptional regulator with XRE-family HTH domain